EHPRGDRERFRILLDPVDVVVPRDEPEATVPLAMADRALMTELAIDVEGHVQPIVVMAERPSELADPLVGFLARVGQPATHQSPNNVSRSGPAGQRSQVFPRAPNG